MTQKILSLLLLWHQKYHYCYCKDIKKNVTNHYYYFDQKYITAAVSITQNITTLIFMILQKFVNTIIMTKKLSVRLIRRKKKILPLPLLWHWKYHNSYYYDTKNISTAINMTLKYCGSYYYDSNKMSVLAYLLLWKIKRFNEIFFLLFGYLLLVLYVCFCARISVSFMFYYCLADLCLIQR